MTPKDYLGNIPKVGDIIAVIHNTSTRYSVLARVAVFGFIMFVFQNIYIYLY